MLVSAVVLSLPAGARSPRANRINGWPVLNMWKVELWTP